MLRVNSKDCSSLSKYLDYPKEQQPFFEWCCEEYNLKKRLQICANLFRTLEKIHISGMLFTDISPNNIMIHKTQNGLVFIDTDNTRRRSDPYINVLGTEGYMAPEMFDCIDPQTLSKAKELRVDEDIFMHSAKISTESDVFAAAIIAFQILTLQHPFVGDEVEFGTADDEANALRCKTDYILKLSTNNFSSQPLVKYFDECKIITSKVKLLFETLFVDGKNIPALRPTAMDFFEAFDECLDLLTTCPHCGVSRLISYDSPQFSPAKIECWYCEKEWNSPVSLKIYNDYHNAKNREEIVNLIKNAIFMVHNIKVKVLYGGSLNSKNIKRINKINNLDGYVIGKNSVNIDNLKLIMEEID
jgi:serine/threonine protein kinase